MGSSYNVHRVLNVRIAILIKSHEEVFVMKLLYGFFCQQLKSCEADTLGLVHFLCRHSGASIHAMLLYKRTVLSLENRAISLFIINISASKGFKVLFFVIMLILYFCCSVFD